MTGQKLLSTVGFYALVVVIVVFSVFPFYYAIVTSFATGTELFKVNYLPKAFDWGNYESVLGGLDKAVIGSCIWRNYAASVTA